jgi:hypothetical protein
MRTENSAIPCRDGCPIQVILKEQAFQVTFVNGDDVIQEITLATPYPTPCDSILPRTFERSADRIHPQGSEISFQYKRKPSLCQRTTVSGVTAI